MFYELNSLLLQVFLIELVSGDKIFVGFDRHSVETLTLSKYFTEYKYIIIIII